MTVWPQTIALLVLLSSLGGCLQQAGLSPIESGDPSRLHSEVVQFQGKDHLLLSFSDEVNETIACECEVSVSVETRDRSGFLPVVSRNISTGDFDRYEVSTLGLFPEEVTGWAYQLPDCTDEMGDRLRIVATDGGGEEYELLLSWDGCWNEYTAVVECEDWIDPSTTWLGVQRPAGEPSGPNITVSVDFVDRRDPQRTSYPEQFQGVFTVSPVHQNGTEVSWSVAIGQPGLRYIPVYSDDGTITTTSTELNETLFLCPPGASVQHVVKLGTYGVDHQSWKFSFQELWGEDPQTAEIPTGNTSHVNITLTSIDQGINLSCEEC